MKSENLNQKVLDFSFSCIKQEKRIDINNLYNKYIDTYLYLNIGDVDSLDQILRKLLTDNLVFRTTDGFYSVNPLSTNHIGYMKSQDKENKDNKKRNRSEKIYRFTPILLSIIFGVSTIFFNYINYKLNNSVRNKDHIIDSLSLIIKTRIPLVSQ